MDMLRAKTASGQYQNCSGNFLDKANNTQEIFIIPEKHPTELCPQHIYNILQSVVKFGGKV